VAVACALVVRVGRPADGRRPGVLGITRRPGGKQAFSRRLFLDDGVWSSNGAPDHSEPTSSRARRRRGAWALRSPAGRAPVFVLFRHPRGDITPPVCLASFTGRGNSGASPSKTGRAAIIMAIPLSLSLCVRYSRRCCCGGTSLLGRRPFLAPSPCSARPRRGGAWVCFRNIDNPDASPSPRRDSPAAADSRGRGRSESGRIGAAAVRSRRHRAATAWMSPVRDLRGKIKAPNILDNKIDRHTMTGVDPL
jgi:hypothetical protein